jgi:hypothetical protein
MICFLNSRHRSGTSSGEVTPDPIPNSVVKLSSADGTCPLWDRQSRPVPEPCLETNRPEGGFYFGKNEIE